MELRRERVKRRKIGTDNKGGRRRLKITSSERGERERGGGGGESANQANDLYLWA